MDGRSWDLVECLGRDWPRQRLWQSLSGDPGPGPWEVVDQDGRVEAAPWDPVRRQLAYPADLAAGARRRFRLRRATSARTGPRGRLDVCLDVAARCWRVALHDRHGTRTHTLPLPPDSPV